MANRPDYCRRPDEAKRLRWTVPTVEGETLVVAPGDMASARNGVPGHAAPVDRVGFFRIGFRLQRSRRLFREDRRNA
jgi:hypothetical protein